MWAIKSESYEQTEIGRIWAEIGPKNVTFTVDNEPKEKSWVDSQGTKSECLGSLRGHRASVDNPQTRNRPRLEILGFLACRPKWNPLRSDSTDTAVQSSNGLTAEPALPIDVVHLVPGWLG